MTMNEVEHYLNGLHTKTGEVLGKNVTVERMWPLLSLVGNPQEKLSVIHIAGTSGKTSTAYFIAMQLQQTGKKIGLTVSPHITRINERLQVQGSPIDDTTFCELFGNFQQQIGEDPDATYFEYMVVFVLWSFVQLGVDYAVIETGLGGLHDATNVCKRSDKVCVITDIGYDHQNILGNTLEEIAAQKAGIIHPNNAVFMYAQSPNVDKVFEEWANDIGARLTFLRSDISDTIDKTSQLPLFQQRNWNLALHVTKFITSRDNLTQHNLQNSLDNIVQVPGRMQEVLLKNGQLFVLDGAHNEQKMQALVSSFKHKYGNKKVPVVLAIKQGKDYEAVIGTLAPMMSHAICCGYTARQDMPISAAPPEAIAEIVKSYSVPTIVCETLEQAITQACEYKEPLTLVTGSLYSIGDAIKYLSSKT